MRQQIIENHKRYTERLNLYKSYGYDTLKSRRFILKQSLPLYGRILDVGTGKGHMSLVLAEAGYSIISIDTSRQEQEFAKLNAQYYNVQKRVDFRIDDAEALSFKNKTFDIVICTCLMHHLNRPLKAVDEFLRILTPKGKIIISDFSKEGLEIVGRVHSDEGKVHTATVIGLSKIEDYLKRRNVNFKKAHDRFHEILIIQP